MNSLQGYIPRRLRRNGSRPCPGVHTIDSWVERHDESDKWFPTKELEERLSPLIDEYNEDNFWEDLVFDLARRDLIDRYGEDEVEKMDLKELITREQPFLDKYEQEFSKNGIRNLRIE